MLWVAVLWTFQMNSYTLTQHWSNFLSISIPLAVLPVPSAFSTAVKPCCRCWTSHGTFLFRSTPLTESITTLLPDNSNIVSVYLSFVKLGAVRMHAKLMFWQGFKTHAYILQIETTQNVYSEKSFDIFYGNDSFALLTKQWIWQNWQISSVRIFPDQLQIPLLFATLTRWHCSVLIEPGNFAKGTK